MASNTPDIYFFNPTCEMAIANGTVSWQANRLLQQFEKDLDLIPAFVATKEDILVVHRIPSSSFVNSLNAYGIELPKIILWNEALTEIDFAKLPKGALKPWGWSQVVHHKFRNQLSSFSGEFRQSPVGNWHVEMKELFSRKIALQVLQHLLDQKISGIISAAQLPVICYSEKELIESQQRFGKSVLKAPWSSSGRGLQKVQHGDMNASILNWSRGVLKNQGYLMCEALLDKVFDFAFQFNIKNNGVDYLGTSWFYTDEKGAYRGNYLKMPIDEIPEDHLQLLMTHEHQIVEALTLQLEAQFLGKYIGNAGVDAMLVNKEKGIPAIHPCLEINLRNNMGNVSMALQHMTDKGFSKFEIDTIKALKAEKNQRVFALVEASDTSQFCAYLK